VRQPQDGAHVQVQLAFLVRELGRAEASIEPDAGAVDQNVDRARVVGQPGGDAVTTVVGEQVRGQ
jgi:hypothetical protein